MKYLKPFLILESKNYGNIYHILDEDKLKFVIKTDTLKPYKASNGNSISFTRNKMMNSYLGDSVTSWFKLEIDGEKLSENYRIRPYSYRSYNGGRFEEYEEIVKKPIENISKYVTKLIIIKSRIENSKKTLRDQSISDWFSDIKKEDDRLPNIIKWVYENSPYPIYVQEGSIIKKDDDYINSIINHPIKKVTFKYDIWYRGMKPSKRHRGGYNDVMIDSDGREIVEWVIGEYYDKPMDLKDYEELDFKSPTKEIYGEVFRPYIIKFRDIGEKYYLEDARALSWVK